MRPAPTRARITSGALAELDFGPDWFVDVASDWTYGHGLTPGRYEVVSGHQTPFAQVGFAGFACTGVPTGSFTIIDIAPTDRGDEPPLTRLIFWFDLSCTGHGRLTGCVRYGG